MTIKQAIRESRAARREMDAIRAQISAAREAAGVSPLMSWSAPFDLRDALAVAEARFLAADRKVAEMQKETA